MKTKILTFFSARRVLAIAALLVLVLCSRIYPVVAQEFIQGYKTDQPLQRGMIVRLSDDDPQKVEALKAKDTTVMHGVVVDAGDAAATLSSDEDDVFIATKGKYEVLVSDENGPIKAGDYLSLSTTEGIAMKADSRTAVVVGKAIAEFNGQQGTSTAKVGSRTVRLARVLTDISIAANPLFRQDTGFMPGFVQEIAASIADKPVSMPRLYLGMLLMLVTAFVTGTLLYSSVRGGLVAIGRNPLSRATITRNMLRVVFLSLIIFVTGLFGVYLLLKL